MSATIRRRPPTKPFPRSAGPTQTCKTKSSTTLSRTSCVLVCTLCRLGHQLFVVATQDDVRKSAGWTRALELMKDEHLVGGSVILNKVLEGVVAAQEAKK